MLARTYVTWQNVLQSDRHLVIRRRKVPFVQISNKSKTDKYVPQLSLKPMGALTRTVAAPLLTLRERR